MPPAETLTLPLQLSPLSTPASTPSHPAPTPRQRLKTVLSNRRHLSLSDTVPVSSPSPCNAGFKRKRSLSPPHVSPPTSPPTPPAPNPNVKVSGSKRFLSDPDFEGGEGEAVVVRRLKATSPVGAEVGTPTEQEIAIFRRFGESRVTLPTKEAVSRTLVVLALKINNYLSQKELRREYSVDDFELRSIASHFIYEYDKAVLIQNLQQQLLQKAAAAASMSPPQSPPKENLSPPASSVLPCADDTDSHSQASTVEDSSDSDSCDSDVSTKAACGADDAYTSDVDVDVAGLWADDGLWSEGGAHSS